MKTECRRCLEKMREEFTEGRLEMVKEIGGVIDAADRTVNEFYKDYIVNGDGFCASPQHWAEEIKTRGKEQEALDCIEKIGLMLENVASLDALDELLDQKNANRWLLLNKHGLRGEIFATQAFLERMLRGDYPSDQSISDFIVRYGKGRFLERIKTQEGFFLYNGEAEPEELQPLQQRIESCLSAYPNWIRLAIESIALSRGLLSSDDPKRGTLGKYNPSTGTLSISAQASTSIITHEIGHVIETDHLYINKLDTKLRTRFIEAVLEELPEYSSYATMHYARNGEISGLQEDFAETWRCFVVTPENLKSLAPKRYAAMDEISRSLDIDVVALRIGAKRLIKEYDSLITEDDRLSTNGCVID